MLDPQLVLDSKRHSGWVRLQNRVAHPSDRVFGQCVCQLALVGLGSSGMEAYEVVIVEPLRPWLHWRRLAPRWLRYTVAVPSSDTAIAEAEWWWSSEFRGRPLWRARLACRGLEELPARLVPHGVAAGPLEEIISRRRVGWSVVQHGNLGTLQLHEPIDRPPFRGEGGSPGGVREPRGPEPQGNPAAARAQSGSAPRPAGRQRRSRR